MRHLINPRCRRSRHRTNDRPRPKHWLVLRHWVQSQAGCRAICQQRGCSRRPRRRRGCSCWQERAAAVRVAVLSEELRLPPRRRTGARVRLPTGGAGQPAIASARCSAVGLLAAGARRLAAVRAVAVAAPTPAVGRFVDLVRRDRAPYRGGSCRDDGRARAGSGHTGCGSRAGRRQAACRHQRLLLRRKWSSRRIIVWSRLAGCWTIWCAARCQQRRHHQIWDRGCGAARSQQRRRRSRSRRRPLLCSPPRTERRRPRRLPLDRMGPRPP